MDLYGGKAFWKIGFQRGVQPLQKVKIPESMKKKKKKKKKKADLEYHYQITAESRVSRVLEFDS